MRNIVRWAVFCLVLLAAGLHAFVKLWLGPAYVGNQVKQTLAEYWSGPVGVEDVDFHYDGVMFVRDVIFYDREKTEVMRAEGIKLVLGNWPSLSAPAKIIEVQRLDVRLRLDARPILPIQRQPKTDTREASLQYMSVKDVTVRALSNGYKMLLGGVFAEVSREENIYKLNVRDNEDSARIRIAGTVDPNGGQVEFNLKFAQTLEREQMDVLLSVMNVPKRWGCRGKFDADMSVLGNFLEPESLWPEGIVSFDNWEVFASDIIYGRELSGRLLVSERHLALEQAAGVFCGGRLKASLYADIKQSGYFNYGGDVLARDVNMAQLTELMQGSKKFTRGRLLLNLRFAGDSNNVESINADGSALIDDADLWRFPLVGALFKAIGIWEYQVGGMSDAEVVFTLSGPQMSIRRGHLSNRFSAIEAEPGGKIDLRSGQVDMLVVVMPLKNVDKLVGSIPVVNWFAHFKDKLIRLRLKGHWSDPAGKLISKQPIKDLTEATVGFIIDVVESGGQFTDKVKNQLGFGRADKKPKDE